VIATAKNTLLSTSALPVLTMLQKDLKPSVPLPDFHATLVSHHREIADAIAESDPHLAEEQMRNHLDWLRPFYEQAWRYLIT
jgi:DNA-binding GntR family transcriptional regulator